MALTVQIGRSTKTVVLGTEEVPNTVGQPLRIEAVIARIRKNPYLSLHPNIKGSEAVMLMLNKIRQLFLLNRTRYQWKKCQAGKPRAILRATS